MAASTSQAAIENDFPSVYTGETDNAQDAGKQQGFVSYSVLCLHDFNPEDAGLLPFRKNEVLDIIKRDESGWWAAIRQRPDGPVVGWIPQAYVSVLSEEMAIKLRSGEKRSGQRERGVEYPHSTLNDCSSSASIVEDDIPFQVSSIHHPVLSIRRIRILAICISYWS
jgi:son of sevenless-like protein